MKLILYDHLGENKDDNKNEKEKLKGINLKNLYTFQERLDFLKNEVFNKERYKIYYKFLDYEEDKNLIKNLSKYDNNKMDDRWLGTKKVGSPIINNHVRNVLNAITTYLLNAKELTVDHKIKRYILLRQRNISKTATQEELDELQSLEQYVLFCKTFPRRHKKEPIIFFINEYIELMFKENNKEKYDECQELKEKVNKVINKINLLKKENSDLKVKIKQKYIEIKNKNNKKVKDKIFDEINGYVLQLAYNDEYILFLENEIANLASDYKYLTEYK